MCVFSRKLQIARWASLSTLPGRGQWSVTGRNEPAVYEVRDQALIIFWFARTDFKNHTNKVPVKASNLFF